MALLKYIIPESQYFLTKICKNNKKQKQKTMPMTKQLEI